jgi:hypothetical protein
MPATPTLGRLRQEDQELEASLSYIVIPWIKNSTFKTQKQET